METVQVFKTSDNKLFESSKDALHHEKLLQLKPEIVAFIASDLCEYKGLAHQTMIERAIINWILWKEKS